MKIIEIDDSKAWDDFVLKTTSFNSILVSSSWLKFEKVCGKQILKFKMVENNKIVGLIPVSVEKINEIKFLNLRHGPIFDFENKLFWIEFIKFIKQVAKEQDSKFVRMCPMILEDEELKFAEIFSHFRKAPKHDEEAEFNLIIDLNNSKENLRNKIEEHVENYIQKFEKRSDIQIVFSSSGEDFVNFIKVFKSDLLNNKETQPNESVFKNLFNAFKPDERIEIASVMKDGEVISSALVLIFGNETNVYYYCAKNRKSGILYFLIWQIILHAKKIGLKTLNLGKISSYVVEGGSFQHKSDISFSEETLFKLGFGGRVRQIMHPKDMPLNKGYNLIPFIEKIKFWLTKK